jgi:antitoxin HicB
MHTFTYPAIFEPGEKAGAIVVTFPDVPEAISQGYDDADARTMGSDALGVALLGLLSIDRPLPDASKPQPGQIMLSVDADVAAKLAVIEAFKASQITQTELAKRLRKDTKEVRRILNPDHATKMPALVSALAALGRRLVISVEAA